MNCRFCVFIIGGFVRNFLLGEMVDQIINVENFIGKRIINVVLMGSGELFDNIENVFKFIEIINLKEGKNIGVRYIIIFIVGIVEGIYRFCDFLK